MWKKLFGRRAAAAAELFKMELEESGADRIRLTTRGLSSTGVRELEIVDVPGDLAGEARELLTLIALRVMQEKPERDGASVGGALVDSAQAAIHIATLRVAAESITPGARELFRIVDFNERIDSGFPVKLFATHLAVVAPARKKRQERERLARRSVQLSPGEAAVGSTQERFDRGENVGNFLGWEALGDVLFETGRIDEGRAALREAAKRCPAWAADFAQHVRSHAAGSSDPRMQFWITYDESA